MKIHRTPQRPAAPPAAKARTAAKAKPAAKAPGSKKRLAPAARQKRSAAKRGRGAKHPSARFVLCAAAVLACSALASLLAASAIIQPTGQIGQMDALPARSVIGQQTDTIEFWARAQYREADRTRTLSHAMPLFASEALQLAGSKARLDQLFAGLRTSDGQQVQLSARNISAVTPYYTFDSSQEISCDFVDQIPCSLVYGPSGAYTLCEGSVDISLGHSSLYPALFCYTLLFTPKDQLPTEEQFAQAYQDILWQLLLMAGYPSEGSPNQLSTHMLALLDDFSLEGLSGQGMPPESANALRTSAASAANALLSPGYRVQANGWGALDPLGLFNDFDIDDPASQEAYLQSLFQLSSIDLQIIRLEQNYLVLFNCSQTAAGCVVGMYYDPILGCWSGMGIQNTW